MNQPKEVEFAFADMTIRGFRSSPASLTKVICLHGWLDNANSFHDVYPHLKNCDVVALDLPGHGRSDHYHNTVPYTVASSMHYVLRVAEKLKFNRFHLVGHSLGGGIAPLCAVAEPKAVLSLSLIDALGPSSEPDSALPERLLRFHREIGIPANPRLFNHAGEAVAVRMKAATMTQRAARLIVERQLNAVEDKLQWSFDSKLRSASPSYFTEGQVQALLGAIRCPVLCLIAEDGYLVNNKHLSLRKSRVKNLEAVTLPGNHHFHMDTPEPIGQEINRFISKHAK